MGTMSCAWRANCAPTLFYWISACRGLGGIEVTRRLKEALPELRVLILTAHEDESLLREAVQAGAAGYIIKRAVESELINAIHSVWRGDLYVHPAMTRALLKETSLFPAMPEPSVESLTPREIEVLRLIAKGIHQWSDCQGVEPQRADCRKSPGQPDGQVGTAQPGGVGPLCYGTWPV